MDNYVQEAYYGKLPEFEQLEKLFDKLIKHAKKDGLGKCNPNKYSENKKICDIFSKVFGFKESIIYWEPFLYANAATNSCNLFLIYTDKKKLIEKRPDRGFYDSSHTILLTVYISVGVIKKNLTPRELIATILHEIGHNFDYSNYHKFEAFIYTIETFGGLKKEIKKYKDETNDMKQDDLTKTKMEHKKYWTDQKSRDRLNKKIEKYENTAYKEFISDGKVFSKSFPLKILSFVVSPFCQIYHLGGKKAEIFADSFATSYGYGTELISALEKMGDIVTPNKFKTPSDRFFFDLGLLAWEMSNNHIGEVHGNDMERCQECIKKLKWDLKHNDFPPNLKKELVNEINSLTDMYKNFYKITSKNDDIRFTKIYRRYLSILWGGRPNIIKFLKRNKV